MIIHDTDSYVRGWFTIHCLLCRLGLTGRLTPLRSRPGPCFVYFLLPPLIRATLYAYLSPFKHSHRQWTINWLIDLSMYSIRIYTWHAWCKTALIIGSRPTFLSNAKLTLSSNWYKNKGRWLWCHTGDSVVDITSITHTTSKPYTVSTTVYTILNIGYA